MSDEKVEQAELDAYMDGEKAEYTEDERKNYLKFRYEQTKGEYKSLQLQKEEIEKSKREDQIANLNKAFGDNYKARKYLVRELRKLGEKVEDRFVPLSA